VAPVSLNFAANKLGRSDLDVRILNNMATQADPCTGIAHNVAGVGIAPMGIQSDVVVERLKPLKLYLAVFKATFNGDAQEVHRYNFQTSRYADFPEQVNSFRLTHPVSGAFLRNAIYDDIAVTLDATRTSQLQALLDDNYPPDDPLRQEYADPFDRLMDGILRTGPMDPPTGTDFTIVRNAANGNVLGVLVRNPEPFNDPKIPASDAAKTIVLSQGQKTFRTLYSKDRSRAFLSEASLNLALVDLDFTFTYLTYDGATYAAASVVSVSLFPGLPVSSSTGLGDNVGVSL